VVELSVLAAELLAEAFRSMSQNVQFVSSNTVKQQELCKNNKKNQILMNPSGSPSGGPF